LVRPLQSVCVVYLIHIFSGDKSNHVPSLHPPQLYYFIAFATIMGWPALISGDSGWKMLVNDVRDRVFGNRRCVLIVNAWCEDLNCSPLIRRMMGHVAVSIAMGLSIKLFTWVRVTLERIPLTLSLCAEFITLFCSRTTDITHFMSGDGYSYYTPSYRTCSSQVTSCVHGYGSCVWVSMNGLPRS
jgi:DIE2/ALG10 family